MKPTKAAKGYISSKMIAMLNCFSLTLSRNKSLLLIFRSCNVIVSSKKKYLIFF